MTEPRTALAIVGLGRWGKVMVDSVRGISPAVRFAAAVGRDAARIADDAAARGLSVLPSLDAALADPAIHGIVLATPHSSHAAQIAACIAARKPVLVEKPFTLTREDAARVLDSAREAGVLVAAAHNRRFLLPIVQLKRMVATGELGTILHLAANFSGNSVGRYPKDGWRLAPGESPAGGMAGSGIHHIDAFIHLEGPIAEVYATTARRLPEADMDDTTAVLFRFRSGASATLLTVTATAPSYRLEVFGTTGRAEMNGVGDRRGTETMVVTRTDGTTQAFDYPALDIERAELEAFAAAITGEAPYPIAADEVVNGVAAFEAVSVSAERHAPVVLP